MIQPPLDPAKKQDEGNFLGGPVAKTLCYQCRGPGFDSWSGNLIPHATTKTQHSQINNFFFLKKQDGRMTEALQIGVEVVQKGERY